MRNPEKDLQPERNAEPKAPVKDPSPKRNAKEDKSVTGGIPVKASNVVLMGGLGTPEYYSAGTVHYPAHKLAEAVMLRAMANFWEKQAAVPMAPAPQAPGQVVPPANTYDQVAQNLVGQMKAKVQPQQQAPAPAAMPPAPGVKPGLPKTAEGIPGGLAAGQPDSKYPQDELGLGKQVETEHSSNPAIAKDIAKDHLEEHDKYYTELEKMEKRLEQDEKGESQEKVADVPRFMKQQQFLLMTPDGKIVVKPGSNRRFDFPAAGAGKPVPYEGNVIIAPPEGVAEPGYHGYDIRLHEGESPDVPAGYEAREPMGVLKDMYASMGMATNRPFRELDRARSRAILRILKRKAKAKQVEQPAVV